MNVTHPFEKKKNQPDFSLLISKLEARIIGREDQTENYPILKNSRIWQALDADRQLKWSNLAQMAGDLDTALCVLSHIQKTAPQIKEAWQNHLMLLSVLGRKEEIARVLARAQFYVDREVCQQWVKAFSAPKSSVADEDVQAATLPFEKLEQRRKVLGQYLNLFCGREDCFARQWVDKRQDKQGYVPVRRPLEMQDLKDHFKGFKTYGIYLMMSDGCVKTAVIDVDLNKALRGKWLKADEKNRIKREFTYLKDRITELSEMAGMRPIIEFSGGKGYHFWYFFEIPTKPHQVRIILENIKKSVTGDISVFSIEVFPKQDHFKGKGLGNLVKLPLGVHRLTGKRSYFIQCRNRSIDKQLDFLSGVRLTNPEKLKSVTSGEADKTVFIHPRWKKWSRSYPELFALENKCPPLAQIIAACRNTKSLSMREEKILFQTIGFLPRAKTLLHHLLSALTDYNPHLLDYKLSRIRGTPLGCKRIHSLLIYTGDLCPLNASADYLHPLLHLDEWSSGLGKKAGKMENLSDAIENLKVAIIKTQRFLK